MPAGLGAATVRRLLEIGVGVTIFDRDADRASDLARELGDTAVAVSGDVNDDDAVLAAVTAARALGQLSILVSVAGGGVGGGRTVGRGSVPHDKDSFRADHGHECHRDVQRRHPAGSRRHRRG